MSRRCPIWKDGKQCILFWRRPRHERPHQFDRWPTELEAMAAERDSLKHALETAQRERDEARTLEAAIKLTESACRCGSGAHPRRCIVHPKAYDHHVFMLNEEGKLVEQIENLTAERDALNAEVENLTRLRDSWESTAHKVKADLDQKLDDADDAWHSAEKRRIAAESERDAARAEVERLTRDRDSWANSDFERQLDEARAECERMKATVQAISASIDIVHGTRDGISPARCSAIQAAISAATDGEKL